MTKRRSLLLSDILFPELELQLSKDPSLWPNIHGLFIINVLKRRSSASTWYILLQGNQVTPIITKDDRKARSTAKSQGLPVVKIRLEDGNVLNFVTGGMTGVHGYMSGKIKIKGDLMLAQRLERVFHSVGGVDRALEFIMRNQIPPASNKAKL